MTQPQIIDTKMHGHDGITATFLLAAEQTALIETGPKSVVDNVLKGLEDAGVDVLDWIIVTHIHLDHAGAAGTLARRFPHARIGVHGVGAPHLADPDKLWKSAARIYGKRMEKLWGGIDPISADRITVIEDGDKIDLGGRVLQAVETPGHAYHHHAYLDDATGILFAGDALGVRLPDVGIVRPATPPPEFHMATAIASIEKIRRLDTSSLWLTHFGPHDGGDPSREVAHTCDDAIEALRTWGRWVASARTTTTDLEDVAEQVEAMARARAENALAETAIRRMENTTSYWMNAWGYMRYFDKHPNAVTG